MKNRISPVKIKLADDSILLSYGKGDVKLAVSDDGDNKIIILKDVLYVTNIQNNLFSLPAMTVKAHLFLSTKTHVK